MDTHLIQYIGLIAGFFTTVCYIPQLIRVFKMRSAREISTLYTILILVGSACWLVYGFLTALIPLILWNMIVLVLVCILLYAKLRYGREETAKKGSV